MKPYGGSWSHAGEILVLRQRGTTSTQRRRWPWTTHPVRPARRCGRVRSQRDHPKVVQRFAGLPETARTKRPALPGALSAFIFGHQEHQWPDFVDRVTLHAAGGNGGNGVASIKRESSSRCSWAATATAATAARSSWVSERETTLLNYAAARTAAQTTERRAWVTSARETGARISSCRSQYSREVDVGQAVGPA